MSDAYLFESHCISWSENCALSDTNANQAKTFVITDTKLYIPVVTLTPQDNAKLLQQFKSGFKLASNWNKY